METSEELRNDMVAIQKSSTQIDDMLRRIATATEEQNATTQEIGNNMESMKRVAENNATASEEITATVIEMSHLAESVRGQVDKFKVGEVKENQFSAVRLQAVNQLGT